MNIPFSPPDINQDDINEVINTLKSGWITTGPKTKLLEKKLAQYCGVNKAVCLNSATAGLELILRLLEIGKGDEVITTAYTYTASASTIAHVGATPVIVDVDEDNYNISISNIEKAITNKTKAIIAVDIGGVPCDYDAIFNIINKNKNLFIANNSLQKKYARIILIDDAAHSLGAEYKNKKIGSVADFSSFSFHAVKNLTTAEGGAVTWKNHDFIDDELYYKNIMLLALHGQSKDALSKSKLGGWKYDIKTLGYKCNMTDISASLGLSQLKRYSETLNYRKEIADIYYNAFKNCEYIESIIQDNETYKGSYHLFLTRIKGIDEVKRDKIIEKIGQQGIGVNVHYIPLPMHTAYKNLGFDISNYPNSYEQYANEISLPLNSIITRQQAEFVAKTFIKIIDKIKNT